MRREKKELSEIRYMVLVKWIILFIFQYEKDVEILNVCHYLMNINQAEKFRIAYHLNVST